MANKNNYMCNAKTDVHDEFYTQYADGIMGLSNSNKNCCKIHKEQKLTHYIEDTNQLICVYCAFEKYKLSKIDKTIKPQVFQLFEPQTYFYEGLIRIDVLPKHKASVSFYINNNIEIHRTKYENGDEEGNDYNDFKLRVKPLVISEYRNNDYKLFIIKGLGFIKVNGKADIKVHSLQDVRIYESEIDL